MATIRKALAMGASSALHIADEALLGADITLTAEALAAADVESIAQIPLSLALSTASDTGVPVVLSAPNSVEAQAFAPMVSACIKHAQAVFAEAAKHSLHEFSQASLPASELEQALSAVPAEEQDALRQQLQDLLGSSNNPA